MLESFENRPGKLIDKLFLGKGLITYFEIEVFSQIAMSTVITVHGLKATRSCSLQVTLFIIVNGFSHGCNRLVGQVGNSRPVFFLVPKAPPER